jgi:hypothetical protein
MAAALRVMTMPMPVRTAGHRFVNMEVVPRRLQPLVGVCENC